MSRSILAFVTTTMVLFAALAPAAYAVALSPSLFSYPSTVYDFYSSFGSYAISLSLALRSGCIEVLLCLLLSAGVCWLLVARLSYSSSSREIKAGILGGQRAIRSKIAILARNIAWNGRSKAKDHGLAVGCIGPYEVIAQCVHAAIAAPSGSGKSRCSFYLTIDYLTWANPETGEGGDYNLVVTDPSLELWAQSHTALEARGYNVFLLDLGSASSNKYNPLSRVVSLYERGDLEAAQDASMEIGDALYPEQGDRNDIFRRGAGGIFSAVAYAIATSPDIDIEKKHLYSVSQTIIAGTMDGTDALMDWIKSFGADSPCVSMAATWLSADEKLKGAILSSLHDGLHAFRSPSIRLLTSGNDVHFERMFKERTAVFLRTLPDGNSKNHIASLFLQQLWTETDRCGRKRGSIRPCTVLMDEAHSIPRFDLVTAIEQGRKYGLAYFFAVQSFETGFSKYGDDGKKSILQNCSTQVLFSSNLPAEAEYFSKLSGQKTIMLRNSGTQRRGIDGGSSSEGFSESSVPVFRPGDILENDPKLDGVLVVKSVAGSRFKSGRFVVPVRDVTRTPTRRNFGTFGPRKFESELICRELDSLERRAGNASEVPVWVPDFFSRSAESARGVNREAEFFGL